jgi:diguanylate cyclase (GGDEF)-like protein
MIGMAFPSQGKHGFDSAFARQMDAGYPWLRFDAELEPGFRESHRTVTLPFVRAALWIVLLLVGLFVGSGALGEDGVAAMSGALLPAALFALVVLPTIVASYLPGRPALFRGLVTATAATATTGAVLWNLVTPAPQAQLAFAAIPVAIAFVYFALGLQLRTAALLALVATAVYGVGAWLVGLPPDVLASNVTVLLLASAICGVGGYMLEYTLRTGYLEGQLLGEMVDRDGLTGLFNRRAFDRHLEQAWSVARRQRAALSLLLVDIDHFKRYNDRHGHQAGDECLQQVAACVSAVARRPLDLAARYGGEEFVVILYGNDQASALRHATSLVDRVRKRRIMHDDSDVAPVVTISVGLATVVPAETDRSPQGVIQLADRCLYQAKRDGRNRVVGEHAADVFIQTGIFEVS